MNVGLAVSSRLAIAAIHRSRGICDIEDINFQEIRSRLGPRRSRARARTGHAHVTTQWFWASASTEREERICGEHVLEVFALPLGIDAI
jgi:hypothetical protein